MAWEASQKISPFVLCGGAGTRLWPLSREALPKQFHRIGGAESLLQQACRRLQGDTFGQLFILGNRQHRFLIAEQLESINIKPRGIVLEPMGRNTAPAACVAALIAGRVDPDSLILLVPSDHAIGDGRQFSKAIETGIAAAEAGALVTFGVHPDSPHTGYGYIETENSNHAHLKVRRFIEKPTREAAEAFIDSGSYYWNTGIFLVRAATLLDLFEKHAPDVLAGCHLSLEQMQQDLGFQLLNGAYTQVPAISLDYAVAEKADNLCCVPLNAAWSDVGSWAAVWELLEKDANGNVHFGEGEVLFENSSGSLAFSDNACVALVGVDNLVVVATEDAVLVVAKEYAESVKSIVEHLKGNGRSHVLEHTRVYRPWGWYQHLNRGDRYQVKCIMVKPGGTLSLQSHLYRSEHWVVVRGTFEVTRGDRVEILTENQSTFIPIGEKHRLANRAKIPAFLIEVQSGDYLGEDDIIRYDDVYRRNSND